MTRKISISELSGKNVFSQDGTPLYKSEEEPKLQQLPAIHITCQIPEIIIPETVVNVSPPIINIEATDTTPIVDAILQGMASIEIPPAVVQVETPTPIDMTPIANILAEAMREVNSKPDHSEAIKDLLAKIASRPMTSSWTFKVIRDANGDVEDVIAIPNREPQPIEVAT